jgi:hypothetical protein
MRQSCLAALPMRISPDTVEISDESDLLRPDKGVLPRASHYSAALGSTALYLGLGLADCY